MLMVSLTYRVSLPLQVGSVFTSSDADLGANLDPDHRLLLRFVNDVEMLQIEKSGDLV